LTQKESKKVKTPPASLKKPVFASGNYPNLFPPFVGNFKQGQFFPLALLFFGSPDEVDPNLPKDLSIEHLHLKCVIAAISLELFSDNYRKPSDIMMRHDRFIEKFSLWFYIWKRL